MSKYYSAIVKETNDGTGDGLLTFSEEFLKDQDWREGDSIVIKVINMGLTLSNQTKELRERLDEKRGL